MTIIYISESSPIRDQVKRALASIKDFKPDLSVLDVGAAANPWLGDVVSDTLDFFPVVRANQQTTSHLGDINMASSFAGFRDKQFDFVSCTHTLEDIRDPLVSLSAMQRIAKAGFIAVPNRHTELSNLQMFSPFGSPSSVGGHHLGFAHHRWIFHVRTADTLEAVAKWSGIAGTQSRYETWIKKLSSLPFINYKKKGLCKRLGVREHGAYPWIDPKLVGMPDVAELSILWIDSIDFSYLNNDYAGFNYADMFSKFDEFTSAPFATSPYVISDALKQLSSTIS